MTAVERIFVSEDILWVYEYLILETEQIYNDIPPYQRRKRRII